jgi:hypothetical protein
LPGEPSKTRVNSGLIDIRFVAVPDRPHILPRPAKLKLQDLLQPGEKVVSQGTLKGSAFLDLNEGLVRLIMFAAVLVVSSQYWKMLFGSSFIRSIDSTFPQWQMYILFLIVLFILCHAIKKAQYILTDRRLMRIAQMVQVFELADFDHAQARQGKDGASFIELWLKDAIGPQVVLQLSRDGQEILESFPLTVSRREEFQNISPAASDGLKLPPPTDPAGT